ncbi:type IV secretory pathway TrbL component [Bradyrhizobium yuanmingense]
MNNVGVIDTFLNTFTTYIDSGFGLIKGEVTYLSSTLIVIDITLAGLFWAWGADEDILQRLVKKNPLHRLLRLHHHQLHQALIHHLQ